VGLIAIGVLALVALNTNGVNGGGSGGSRVMPAPTASSTAGSGYSGGNGSNGGNGGNGGSAGGPCLVGQPCSKESYDPIQDPAFAAVVKSKIGEKLGLTVSQVQQAIFPGGRFTDLAAQRGITAAEWLSWEFDMGKTELKRALDAGRLSQGQFDQLVTIWKGDPGRLDLAFGSLFAPPPGP
jgi:hypothetical protein